MIIFGAIKPIVIAIRIMNAVAPFETTLGNKALGAFGPKAAKSNSPLATWNR
jgi:hypothetical protein